MPPFDPETHGFVELRDFKLGGCVTVHEWKNHSCVDGLADQLRLNVYLSRDGSFVNIWWGLLEPMFAEVRFERIVKRAQLNFMEQYNEMLFRGWISSQNDAEVILRTTGITTSGQFALPQVLSGAPDDFRCEVVSSECP